MKPRPLIRPLNAHRLQGTLLLRDGAIMCAILWAVAVPATALAQAADSPLPTVQTQRITDSAISADHQAMAALQARLQKLNAQGLPVQGYHFAKAQCWLDFAFHEYHQNDRTGVTEDALRHSSQLTALLEQGAVNLPMDTPHPASAQALRPDLWATLQALKTAPGAQCAAARTACAEVRLVWAGHELKQTGWRHASPWVGVAEDMVADAQRDARLCPAPLVAQTAAPAAPLPALPPVILAAPEPETPKPPAVIAVPVPAPAPLATAVSAPEPVANVVHFALDQSRISAASAGVLDRIAAVLRAQPGVSLLLRGHTDVRASASYNHQLAQRRVQAVQGYLVAAGVASERVRIEAVGMAEPVQAGRDALDHAINRRVQLVFSVAPGLTQKAQTLDLQPER